MAAIITLALLAILVLYLGLFKLKHLFLPVTIVGLLLAAALDIPLWFGPATSLFHGMVLFDHYALSFSLLSILATIVILLLSKDYFDKASTVLAEYYALLLFSLTGVLMVVSFHNLAMLFIGLEIMSVALYILAGIRKKDLASNEASMKYFLMGAFSTGFLLFGITLLYGASGTFDLNGLSTYVNSGAALPAYFYVGILLLLIGMLFKVGAAPFHFWTPDVYEGSPILITTFMSTVVKVAAFAAFFRLFNSCFTPLSDFWTPVLNGVAIVTLFVGNITALVQTSFKRMLAYSSISHAGYMLFALIGLSFNASNALFTYAVSYIFASIIAFTVLMIVKRTQGSENFDAFNGLGKANPWLAIPLTIAMLSLAGIPATAGFIGKFMMFSEVLSQNHVTLVILAAINAAMGIYYYFHVIINMYFKDQGGNMIHVNSLYKVVLIISILITIIVGVYPAWITGII